MPFVSLIPSVVCWNTFLLDSMIEFEDRLFGSLGG